jgi:orotidine-5'-phosphate decarboxylase
MPATRAAPIPIVALDVPSLAEARDLVKRLGPAAGFYKVGLQLFTKEGPAVVEWLRGETKRVFLDLKLHDIPNTVRGAAASAGSLGVDLLTVHAIGGEAMLRAAVEGAASTGMGTGVLGVTVLTSFSDAEYAASIGTPGVSVSTAVLRLAALSARCGARGVVCAGAEAAGIRAIHGEGFGTLVPGLRTEGSPANDQARTATPLDVRAAGATWVVVGRAVTAAEDPEAAYRSVFAALSGVSG